MMTKDWTDLFMGILISHDVTVITADHVNSSGIVLLFIATLSYFGNGNERL